MASASSRRTARPLRSTSSRCDSGKIETALQRCGLEPERRRFTPHVTLARLDNAAETKLVHFVQAHNLFRTEPIPVEHFTLFSSLLNKDHAVYTPEVEYELT